jgi:hypothetical protein
LQELNHQSTSIEHQTTHHNTASSTNHHSTIESNESPPGIAERLARSSREVNTDSLSMREKAITQSITQKVGFISLVLLEGVLSHIHFST